MALSPKYQRYADRLQSLIEEGNAVAKLPVPGRFGDRILDKIPLQSWLTRVRNMLEKAFGRASPHYQQYLEVLPRGGVTGINRTYQVEAIVGVLDGALGDLADGFLTGREFLIAGEIFDSVLDQAKHLTGEGYKDPAAVLARVVLEDALKRIASAITRYLGS